MLKSTKKILKKPRMQNLRRKRRQNGSKKDKDILKIKGKWLIHLDIWRNRRRGCFTFSLNKCEIRLLSDQNQLYKLAVRQKSIWPKNKIQVFSQAALKKWRLKNNLMKEKPTYLLQPFMSTNIQILEEKKNTDLIVSSCTLALKSKSFLCWLLKWRQPAGQFLY